MLKYRGFDTKYMTKVRKNIKKLVLKSLLALCIYAESSLVLNFITTKFSGNVINYEQAEEIIKSQQEKFYLKNKKINFVSLEGNPLKDNFLRFCEVIG
jgi:hypothetical protein